MHPCVDGNIGKNERPSDFCCGVFDLCALISFCVSVLLILVCVCAFSLSEGHGLVITGLLGGNGGS